MSAAECEKVIVDQFNRGIDVLTRRDPVSKGIAALSPERLAEARREYKDGDQIPLDVVVDKLSKQKLADLPNVFLVAISSMNIGEKRLRQFAYLGVALSREGFQHKTASDYARNMVTTVFKRIGGRS